MLALNFSHCIKASNNLGGTTFYNICDSTNHYVPWGAMDWLGFSLGMAMVSLFIAATVGIAYSMYELVRYG